LLEKGTWSDSSLLQAQRSDPRKAPRHSAAEVLLVPGERTTISTEMAEYDVGKRTGYRCAELGVAVRSHRPLKGYSLDAVAKTTVV
jgi:hypothetical protein